MQSLQLSLPQSSTSSAILNSDEIAEVDLEMNHFNDDINCHIDTDTTSPITPSSPSYEEENKEFLLSPTPDFDDISVIQLFSKIQSTQQQITFFKHGYKIMNKLCNTLQGELFKAISTKSSTTESSTISCVAIKKTGKHLCGQRIAFEEDITFIVDENILKEALILKHLTVDNQCIGDYICKFKDFFECDENLYLVTEYIDSEMNLKQFIKKSFEYMKNGKLLRADYHKTVKYIMWQIAVTIHWLHDVYHCMYLCHKIYVSLSKSVDNYIYI